MNRPGRASKLLVILGGIGAFCFLCCAGLVVAVFMWPSKYGTKVALNKGSELYYTPAVTEAEARKLADYMKKDKTFGDVEGGRFQLNKAGDAYEFRMAVKEEKAEDKGEDVAIILWAALLSTEVFDGAPVDVHLCDADLKTLRVVEYGHNQPKGPQEDDKKDK